MRSFKDNADRTWTLTLNVWTVKKVRDLLGVDLLDLSDSDSAPSTGDAKPTGLIYRLIADPVLLVDVVYAVCKPEADARSIGDEDFGRSMAGDAIESATEALLAEIVDFFPSARDRARLTMVLAKFNQVVAKANDLLDAKANAMDVETVTASLEKMLGDSSGDVPESSASIPAP